MELEREFELLTPFNEFEELHNFIKNIVTATPQQRALLIKRNTFMGKSVYKDLEIDGVTYAISFWHIFCAYGLVDCVNHFANHMRSQKASYIIKRVSTMKMYDALKLAVKFNHTEVVATLTTTQKMDADEASNALTIAAKNNNVPIVKLLLKIPNIALNRGRTLPLQWAVHHRNPELAKILLLAGANIFTRRNDEVIDINYSELTDPKMVALFFMFDRGPKAVNNTGLNISLAKKVLYAVDYVKDQIAKSRIKNANDQQAYNIGLRLLSEVLDCLDDPGQQWQLIHAHLNKISKGVLGTYQFSLFDLQLLDYLYKDDQIWLDLETEKPTTNNTKQLPTLIYERLLSVAPITIRILEPFSHAQDLFPHFKAILKETPERVYQMLDSEAIREKLQGSLDHPTGIKPIHIFCAYGMTKCAEKMIELGDNPETLMTTNLSYTPLMLAVSYQHHETVKMLLRNKVPLFHDDLLNNPNARTPFETAAWNNDLEMIKILLDKTNANPDYRYHLSRATALFAAVDVENVEMCRALLAAGADPTIKAPNCENLSPFELAAQRGHAKILALFTNKEEDYLTDSEEHCNVYNY